MNIARNIEELRSYRKTAAGKVGFVPTMGALHEGHLSLVKKAKEENDYVIVSIFVNPTQFLAGEDIDKYPKKEQADLAICQFAGVDLVFIPDADELYKKDEVKIKAPNIRGYILEGFHRPGHFDGVLRVVLKLFNLVMPDNAYFGKKDAQQLVLIKQMVQDLFMNIEIVPCNTVREKNGLALSSRNVYLNEEEKTRALSLSKSLHRAIKLIKDGIVDTHVLTEEMKKFLSDTEIDYVAITDRELNDIKEVEINNSVVLVAAKVGSTRLIDNMWI